VKEGRGGKLPESEGEGHPGNERNVWSHYCTINEGGEVIDRGRFRTNPSGVDKRFRDLEPIRIAMEAGIHSIWISEQIRDLGHEVIVANVRELRAISHSDRKSDSVDAEKLARYARLDPEILRPIAHRTVAQQETLTLIRPRDVLVRMRTGAVNSVRGLAKPCGYRLPASSTLCFAKRCLAMMPPGLSVALSPLLHQIGDMTVKIKEYDRAIKELTETEYPETQALIKVYGVGYLTALTYVLTLGKKERFQRSRDVGCYLGLRPKRSQSGDSDPQLVSPRLETAICDSCWSSAPTMSSDPMEKTRPCAGGASAWVPAAAAMREDEQLLLWRESLLFCFTVSGSRRKPTYRSMQRQLEIRR
jgi:transposase